MATIKEGLLCTAFGFVTLAVPLLGCWLAVATQDERWLWLLAPLIVFMEAGLGMIAIAWLIVLFLLK